MLVSTIDSDLRSLRALIAWHPHLLLKKKFLTDVFRKHPGK